MNTIDSIPFYARVTLLLIGLYVFVSILSVLQYILIPVIYSVIISILLNPIIVFFEYHKINRIISIIFTLLLLVIIIIFFGFFLYTQACGFGESWPVFVTNFTNIINDIISWLSKYFGTNPQDIHDWISRSKRELISTSSSGIGETLVSFGSGLMQLLLIPVYVFIILYYKPLFLEFIHRVFSSGNQSKVNDIVIQIKEVIQKYLTGLVIEGVIISILNSTALLLLGIEYAILLGIIGALLNVIPYIGGIVAVALPIMVALTTKSSGWYVLYILIIYYIIQLIDNNYIVPRIVASKVKINAFFSIIVVIAGNALWGIHGMFLSIPILAIIKLIFDRVESLKVWGFLLGDTMPKLKIRKK